MAHIHQITRSNRVPATTKPNPEEAPAACESRGGNLVGSRPGVGQRVLHHEPVRRFMASRTPEGRYQPGGRMMADSHPLVPVLDCLVRGHCWDEDPDWPTCIDCGKSKLFLEMIEEIIALKMVSIAQPAERVSVEHEVTGSSPVRYPIRVRWTG
jgi:hypothetical protein